MIPVKLPVLITISTLISLTSFSQLSTAGNSVRVEVEKVLIDYFNGFKNITAEELTRHPQSTDYRSAVSISGAEKCIVTKYSSKKKNIVSWQALMLTTDDFEEAQKKFKALYGQLNNIAVQLNTAESIQFKGKFETPVEEKKFTTTIFSTDSKNDLLKGLKIELAMEYELLEWKVKILVYGREREDNERGEIREGE